MVLQHMRENIKHYKWILLFVIVAFVPVFGYQYVQQQQQESLMKWAYRIDDIVITPQRVSRIYSSMSRLFPNPNQQQREFIWNFVQQTTLEQAILLKVARDLKIHVSDEEVRDYVRDILESIRNQLKAQYEKENIKLSDEEFESRVRQTFRRYLASMNYESLDQYLDDVRQDILIQKVRLYIGAPILPDRSEVEEFYKSQNVYIKGEYVLVNKERYAVPKPREDELKTYYEKNKNRYLKPEARKAVEFLVSARIFLSDLNIPEEKLKAYYEQNKNKYIEPMQVHARHILISTKERTIQEAQELALQLLERLKKGEDFAKLAREYSDDPGSKEKGGDLGWFKRGQMVETFENAAFEAVPNVPVGPVQTQFGLHIIEVLEKKPERLKSFEEVKEDILKQMGLPEARKVAKKWLEEHLEDIKKYPDIPDNVKKKLTIQETNWVKKDDYQIPIQVRTKLFQLTKSEPWSPIITIDENTYGMIYLKDVREPSPKSFTEARDDVLKDWQNEKVLELARRDATALYKKALELNGDLKKAAELEGFKIEETGNIGENQPLSQIGKPVEFTQSLFHEKAGKVFEPYKNDEVGYVVFKLVEVKPFTEEEFKKEYSLWVMKLMQVRRNEFMTSLISRLRMSLTIEQNNQLLSALQGSAI